MSLPTVSVIPSGVSFPFPVQFYGEGNLPLTASDCTIVIQSPAGVVTSGAGVLDADIDAFTRALTVTAGVWYWYGTTTDILATVAQTPTGCILVSPVSVVTTAEVVAALRAVEVAVVAPVAVDQTVTLIKGDSYLDVDGRAVSFDLGTPSYDLTGASAVFVANGVEYPMSIAANVLTLELTEAETLAMAFSRTTYAVVATLDNASVVTPVVGTLKLLNYL